MSLISKVEELIEVIKADYTKRYRREDMIERFCSSLSYKKGKKYIKIIQDGSAWGFIQIEDDGVFKAGDILMSASWSAPARNHARGNVFGEYSVRWTGPHYIRG